MATQQELAARYAEQMSGAKQGASLKTTSVRSAGTGALGTRRVVSSQGDGFLDKVANVGRQSASLGAAIVGSGARFVGNTAVDIADAGYRAARTPIDFGAAVTSSVQARNESNAMSEKLRQLSSDYRAGKVSKDDFNTRLGEIKAGLEESDKKVRKSFEASEKAKQDALGVGETAVNILTLGKGQSLKVAIEKGGKTLANKGLPEVVTKIASQVDDAVSKIPAVRELYARNAKSLAIPGETAAQAATRASKQVAIGLLIKRPIFYQSNIGLVQDTYNDIIKGDYPAAVKDAAWIAAQAVGGGPIGWFFNNAEKAGSKLRNLAHGKSSYIDEMSKKIGNGDPGQLAILASKDKNAEKILRISQEVNLQQADEDTLRAVDNTLNHYTQHGIDLSTVTPELLVQDLGNWASADEIARKLSPKDNPVAYVAVRWDSLTKNALADEIEAVGDDLTAMVGVIESMANQPGVGWGNNRILMAKITNAVRDAGSSREAATAIRAIKTASTLAEDIPSAEAKRLAKLGFTVASPYGGRKTPSIDYADTRKLVSEISGGNTEIFDETIAPEPSVAALASILRNVGLSPESNTKVAYEKLTESMVSNIQELGAMQSLGLVGDDSVKGGKYILSKLQEYIDSQAPNPYLNTLVAGRSRQSALQDVRQLNLKEMMEALPGISRKEAKDLQKAIIKSYTDVPMEFRGLGVKAFDHAYRIPGAAAYFRIQSALRYTYNPFFRAQEVIETKMLTHMKANNLVWMKPKAELDRVSKLINDSDLFTSGYTGEATQDLTLGRLQANLVKTQERDLAGLAMDIANKRGLSIEDMIRDHPDELADALRVIVQYPTKGVLNSPLARTLNIAFFPMRYNIKVAGLVAQEIGKLPPSMQTAFIHSTLNVSDWLKSEEGLNWQAEYGDAIQVFSYFSVLNNLTTVMQRLKFDAPESVGELGMLGGIPFGFFSQLLDNQGLINLNTPYVNPKTGDVLPDHIPQTTRARAAVALESLINTMFTYPGRILGLPGKQAAIRDLTGIFIDTEGEDFEKRYRLEDLTPLQQKTIKVLSDRNATQEQIDELYTSPAPGQFNWYTLPPVSLPEPSYKLNRKDEVLPSSKGARKQKTKKKALPLAPIEP